MTSEIENITPRKVSEQHAELVAAHKDLIEDFGELTESNIGEKIRAISELDSDARANAFLDLFNTADSVNKKRLLFVAEELMEYIDFEDDDQWERVTENIRSALTKAQNQEEAELSLETAEALATQVTEIADDVSQSESFKPRDIEIIDGSLAEIRQHAERYMDKLHTAALAEAALDGVSINIDNPKNQ